MASGKISKRNVDEAKAGERDVFLWDSELSGFGLKVTPADSKVYLIQYRIGGQKGRTRRVTIGRHGSPWTDPTDGRKTSLTPDAARKEAKRLLGLIATGRDPAEEQSEARRDLTVSELCDLYVAEGCAIKKHSTLATDRSNIERHIKPVLGRQRVSSVSRADIERFQQDVAKGKTATDVRTGPRGRAIVVGGKGTAARAVAVLSAIFTFAHRRNLRSDNPVRGVKLYKPTRRERFLSATELTRLGDTLATLEADNTANPLVISAIRLLLLTGARKSEVLGLKWDHVDMERACIRLPESKTGAKVIPLGAPALALLANLPRIEGNPYVLPGVGAGHYVGLQKAWARIRRSAGLEGVRLHDLRHSFASIAVAAGDSLYLVGKVLGHRQARTTEIYAHLADDPLRAVADRTSSAIAAAMNGGKGAEIVELKRNG